MLYAPSPMNDNIRRLENAGLATWPATEQVEIDHWMFCASGGGPRRSNSVTPLGTPIDGDISSAIDTAEIWFAAKNIPPIFRLTPLSPPELRELLVERGYAAGTHSPVHILTRPTDTAAIDPRVTIHATPTPEWLAIADPTGSKGLASLFTHITAGFAELVIDKQLAGIGLTVIDDDIAGLFNFETLPFARRQGVATGLTNSLADYASTHGATDLLIQVVAANESAMGFWQAQGFIIQYQYHYLESTKPSGS